MNNITYVIVACHPDKGMKSHGSKGLLDFNNKKLFEHQFDWIKNNTKNKNYEIIIVCNFDLHRIKKIIEPNIKIFSANDCNPVYSACLNSINSRLLFIDYGCLFNPKVLNTKLNTSSTIWYVDEHKNDQLDTGCIIKDDYIEHIFFDLPGHKFCNIFYLSSEDKQKILSSPKYKHFNLLYFEILNMLIDSGSTIKANMVNNKDFLYFTQMRQKNAINKFIKKIAN
jgi:hypothetical protein